MRLLDRYLLRELLVPLGYILGGLLILWISFSLVSDLNKYQENNLRLFDVVELYAVKIPGDLVLILPITLLLASLYSLTNHTRHHELTAMRAAGVSLWRICVPYLAVGFVLSLGLLFVNERLVPDSAEQQERIMKKRVSPKEGPNSRDVIQASGFVNGRDGHTWTFKSFNLRTCEMLGPSLSLVDSAGAKRQLIADRARWLNGVWTFFGSSAFSAEEINNLPLLVEDLKQSTNELSRLLFDNLSAITRRNLAAYNEKEGRPNLQLQTNLADDFNRLIQRGPLFDARRFAGVALSPEAAFMLKQDLQGGDVIWLNRTLLLDAFPKELDKTKRAFSVHEFEYVRSAGPNSVPRHFVTNLFALPELAETPDQVRREVKFSARLASAADLNKATDISVADVVEYLNLHPTGLRTKQKWWLYTQLHGRLAAPWTCLVVVLIAIPFGAASGRRNIFAGVAGSIGIFFIYFALLKLGLAAGLGGYLPAWLAAWLPNLCFGVAGIWLMLRVR